MTFFAEDGLLTLTGEVMQPNVTLLVHQPWQAVQRWLQKPTAQIGWPTQQSTAYGLAVRTGIKAGNSTQEYHYTLTVEKENK